jgi:hypothetical protein
MWVRYHYDVAYTFFCVTCLLHGVGLYVQDLFEDTFLSLQRRRVIKRYISVKSKYTCQMLVCDKLVLSLSTTIQWPSSLTYSDTCNGHWLFLVANWCCIWGTIFGGEVLSVIFSISHSKKVWRRPTNFVLFPRRIVFLYFCEPWIAHRNNIMILRLQAVLLDYDSWLWTSQWLRGRYLMTNDYVPCGILLTSLNDDVISGMHQSEGATNLAHCVVLYSSNTGTEAENSTYVNGHPKASVHTPA